MTTRSDDVLRPQPLSPEEECLISLYREHRTPLDSLPYSDDFERLFEKSGFRLERIVQTPTLMCVVEGVAV